MRYVCLDLLVAGRKTAASLANLPASRTQFQTTTHLSNPYTAQSPEKIVLQTRDTW